MTTLQKIARFIAEQQMTEKEIYEILLDYMKKRMDTKYLQGWMKRDRMAAACKAAHRSAKRKEGAIEDDLSLYSDTDYTKPLSPYTLITRVSRFGEVIQDDIVEVRHLSPGDCVFIKDQRFIVREVFSKDKKTLIKFK